MGFAFRFGECLTAIVAFFAFFPMMGASGSDLAFEALSVFRDHCVKCHNDRDRDGGLSLVSYEALMQGGESGPIVQLGAPELSNLLVQITPIDGQAEMPKNSPALTAAQVEVVRQWILQGMPWDDGIDLNPPSTDQTDWWSLQPLVEPPIPAVPLVSEAELSVGGMDSFLGNNPIDAFIREKLEEKGLTFAPPATRRVLARRLYFDLIGLPPTPEQLADFLNDQEPGAVERLVDRLLHSPQYGERWARHWLDVVHYADTHGYDKDQPRPNAWPYRDYVIDSLNQDKPWGQMIEEQIAGDVLYPERPDAIEAMGFLSAGPWDLVGHAEVPESKVDGQIARHLDRDDMLRTVVQSLMSVTVGCAQCHTHKFDPIDQVEYYQLQSVFAALDRADKPYYRDPELNARYQSLQQNRSSLVQRIRELEKEGSRSQQTRQSHLLLYLQEQVAANATQLEAMPEPDRVYAGTVHHGSGNFQGTGYRAGAPRTIHVLTRGDVTKPIGQPVSPGGLQWLADLVPGLVPTWPDNFDGVNELVEALFESQQRAKMAAWIASPENSFTWRSIVNRVWQYHFGRGLVDTPDDFGRMGGIPSHPELLDWLAVQFRDHGQSLKHLHRWIVTSRTYAQSSDVDSDQAAVAKALAIDGDNRLFWRANRRKLEAESVRDSILFHAGRLNLMMGGPGFQQFVVQRPEHSPHYRYDLHDFDDPSAHRRSIYRFTVRSQLHPFLNALDCADPSQQVATRNEGQSPLQALAMMNNGLVLTMSGRFAERLQRRSGAAVDSGDARDADNDLIRWVSRGFLEVTGRQPSDSELQPLVDYAAQHGLENTCRILFNLNEFLFVD
jgi:mono/diheme cytochrome c family protein